MDHSSGEETDVSDSEIGAYESKTYSQLKAGKLKVKHGESTFRCPFCLGKKKQDFNLKDLLQHASGIGAATKRKAKVKATHLALARYLKVDLASSSESPLQLAIVEQKPPQNEQEKFVWPWMGILVNVPTELKCENFCGESGDRLRAQFSRFRPLEVTVLWNSKGQVDCAVIKFSENWIGMNEALAFEKHFKKEQYGKTDWNKRNCRRDDLYGWVARSDDYNSPGPIGDHLRKKGELRSVSDLEHEKLQEAGRRVDYFARQIEKTNEHLDELKIKNSHNAMKLDRMMVEKDQLVEEHNKNIGELQQVACRDSRKIIDDNLRLFGELQARRLEIDQRSKELNELATKSNIDRAKLEAAKQKNAKESGLLNLATLKQKKADEGLLQLYEKQKKEKEEALKKQYDLEKMLDSKHKLELEKEQLSGKLEVMKHMGDGEDTKLKKELDELSEKLKEKDEELEYMETMNQTLVVKERRTNDELAEAKKELIIRFEKLAGARSLIGVKRLCRLDRKAFINACKQKLAKDDLNKKPAADLFEEWEAEIKNPEWHPFKVVVTDGKAKEILKEDDEKLLDLRAQLGDEVYNVVVKALLEINEHNPSGRYPVGELWNFKENRVAPISEAATYLVKQWKMLKKK